MTLNEATFHTYDVHVIAWQKIPDDDNERNDVCFIYFVIISSLFSQMSKREIFLILSSEELPVDCIYNSHETETAVNVKSFK